MIRGVADPRWDEWERVTTPALVIYADGGMFAQEQKVRFISRGRNVTRVDLANASHDAHLDAFDKWTDALTTFIGDR